MLRRLPLSNPTASTFDQLYLAVSLIDSGQEDSARQVLQSMPEFSIRENPEDLKASLFHNALSRRLDLSVRHAGNLYLLDFQERQIDLFNLLATRVPLVTLAGWYANAMLERFIGMDPEAILVDIGIGTGQQEVALLRRLKAVGKLPSRFSIIGIEPSAESLRIASRNFEALSAELGVRIDFTPIARCAEDFTSSDWNSLRQSGRQLIFNEAFALHHVLHRADGHDLKSEVIQRIHDLQPLGFVLSEPHSDHETPRLGYRFINAWRHYGLAFEVIDRTDLSQSEKSAIKSFFFAREIEDVMSSDEMSRTERHETAQMWLARLRSAGFSPLRTPSFSDAPHSELVQASSKEGYLGLDTDNQTVVAIIAVS